MRSKNKSLLFIQIVICFFLTSSAMAATIELLIDGSGSMKGFFDAGSIQVLIDRLSNTASRAGIAYTNTVVVSKRSKSGVFNNTKLNYKQFLLQLQRNQKPFGSHTLLDIAFEQRDPLADILFIITDNVQSDKETQGNTDKFYRQFNAPCVKRIYILPELLDFRGRVYFDKVLFANFDTFKRQLIDANGAEKFYGTKFLSGTTSYIAYYRGKRGLIVYAIQLSDESVEAYRKILSSLCNPDGENDQAGVLTPVLRIKPIDQSQVRLCGVDDNTVDVRKAIIEQQSRLSPNRKVRVYFPNMKLHLNPKGNRLAPFDDKNPPSFRLNSENLVRFYFSLSSVLNHVSIGKPDENGKTNVKLSISNPTLRVLKEADKDILEFAPSRGQIIPPHLAGSLKSGDSGAKHYYVAEAKLGPCRIKWSLRKFFTLIIPRKIPVQMNFDIRMVIPPDQLFLAEDFQEKYFTDNLNRIDRIYSPRDLIEYLSKEPIYIDMNVVMDK